MLLQLLLYMIGELREKWMPNGWHNQCHNVAAIGFDGLKTAEGQDYLLSTIAQPIDQMAIAAVELLMTLIKGQVQPSSHRVILPVHFREGGTTRKKLD